MDTVDTVALRPGVTVARALLPNRYENIPVRIANWTTRRVRLPAGTIVNKLESVNMTTEVTSSVTPEVASRSNTPAREPFIVDLVGGETNL